MDVDDREEILQKAFAMRDQLKKKQTLSQVKNKSLLMTKDSLLAKS